MKIVGCLGKPLKGPRPERGVILSRVNVGTTRLLVCGADRRKSGGTVNFVEVWDLKKGRRTHREELNSETLLGALSRNDEAIVLADAETLRLMGGPALKKVWSKPHRFQEPDGIVSVGISGDGKRIALAGGEKFGIVLVDAKTG